MVLPVREVYCPAHFGNSYEAMWPREMANYLAELKFWGFNRYGDWMAATDLPDPYAADVDAYWTLGMELFARKKAAFRAATDLGMDVDLIIAPNHVYVDQLRPDLLATKTPIIIGQLLCPSKPEARAIIHRNLERQFRDLAESGVRISSLTAFAYDYGGCDCADCAPWVLTFAQLVREIHDIARRYHPDVQPWVCSWWWTAEEYRLFNDWTAHTAPGWPRAMVFHIPYGHTGPDRSDVPEGCQKLGFIHIGYGEVAGNGDIYAKLGPVIAPERLRATLDASLAAGAVGYQAYSEGVFDDVNKVVLAALSSGRARDSDEALREYAARYFGSHGDETGRWARWLAAWGNRSAVNLAEAHEEFDHLATTATPGWRLEQFRSKLTLEGLDRVLTASGDAWGERELMIADKFWAEREHLYRDIYRLGPIRAIFTPRIAPYRWYEGWRLATGALASTATVHLGPATPEGSTSQ